MRTILNKINPADYFLGILATTFLLPAAHGQPAPISSAAQISILEKNGRVIAIDVDGKTSYQFDLLATAHLKKADDIRLMPYKRTTKNPVYVILSREPSRPDNMGRGYCGAGHEDYLLLVEKERQKLVLRDKLLLQSCLESRLIYSTAGGDDPITLLTHGNDGSLNFRWEKDDSDRMRRLTVRRGHFLLRLVSAVER